MSAWKFYLSLEISTSSYLPFFLRYIICSMEYQLRPENLITLTSYCCTGTKIQSSSLQSFQGDTSMKHSIAFMALTVLLINAIPTASAQHLRTKHQTHLTERQTNLLPKQGVYRTNLLFDLDLRR
jgi:hypothetical protein